MFDLQEINLVSFKLCPFVQKTVIVAEEKNIKLNVTYIDLDNKSDWFLQRSPLGKVPILIVGEETLFESNVIMDFIDEISEGSLKPMNLVQAAVNKSWIEFSNELIISQFHYICSDSSEKLTCNRNNYIRNLSRINDALNKKPFFNGNDFSLVDVAFAPIFSRQNIIEGISGDNPIRDFPNVFEWGKHLMSRPSVKISLVIDFETLFLKRFSTGSILLTV